MSDHDERGRLIDDDLAAESRAQRALARSRCSECGGVGGSHVGNCPDTPDAPPFDAMTPEERREFCRSLSKDSLIDLCLTLGDDCGALQLQIGRQGTRATGCFA